MDKFIVRNTVPPFYKSPGGGIEGGGKRRPSGKEGGGMRKWSGIEVEQE